MKYDQLGAFFKHLESNSKNTFPPIYLLISQDENLVSWLMRSIAKFFPDFEKGTSLSDMTPSLFSREVLVQLKWEALLEDVSLLTRFIDHPSKGIHVILSLPKLEATNPLYKKIEKAGVVLQALTMKPWEKESFFIEYIVKKAQKERIVFATDAAKALATRSSFDPYAIDSHFEKLVLFKSEEKRVSLQDLNILGPFDEEETLFRFTDALLLKRTSTSQEIAGKLLNQGTSPLAILKTYRNQCILLYDLQQDLDGVIGRHPYLKGNILEQKLTQARMHSHSDLKRLILKCDDLERYYKNTGTTDEIFLELLLSSLS